ncbi:MAG TPA: 3-octaprenyl-4-hydroxybenzoate carboxy-lyase [Desulfotomaculum sp.]|nr:3-octaprenyl-4-hydroxybenzoate carboxy-lyase [Desulfotomaculum sp.]
MFKFKLIVGVSGATGSVYAVRLLEVLRSMPNVETHLVLSSAARVTLGLETDWKPTEVEAMADYSYDVEDVRAPISSGSFQTSGMIIIPCSIKTVSAIANSYNENLLVRAADVCLKEKRKVVIVVRETPLHAGHLRLMLKIANNGGIILPPVPAFYHRPQKLEEVIDHTVGKVLDLFDIPHNLFRRWN